MTFRIKLKELEDRLDEDDDCMVGSDDDEKINLHQSGSVFKDFSNMYNKMHDL